MIKIVLILLVVSIVLNLFLKKPNTVGKRFVSSLLELLSAIILGIFLLPIGFVYSLGKAVVEMKGGKFLKVIYNFFKEIVLSIAWIFRQLAIGIDIMGNVIAGEFIEDIITGKEDTLFGQSGITISASTGHLESIGKLNKVGRWFTKMLSVIFEKNHSINAYNDLQLRKMFMGRLQRKQQRNLQQVFQ